MTTQHIIGWTLVAVGLSGFGYVVVRYHLALHRINATLRGFRNLPEWRWTRATAEAAL